jgi:hypothetical protein
MPDDPVKAIQMRVAPDEPLAGRSAKNEIAGITGFHGSVPAFEQIEQLAVAGDPELGTVALKAGVFGYGNGNGVQGHSSSKTDSGVWGHNSRGGFGVVGTSDKPNGIGVFGRGKALAGKFEGNVEVSGAFNVGGNIAVAGDIDVSGDIRLANADLAEDFDIAGLEQVEPGTIMVIESEGALQASSIAYDKRVIGVISGAGSYRPAIILDNQKSTERRMPIALTGKVYCKVDAQYGSIKVGDLLTTSPTPGYAMKAEDSTKAFGAVIGKALRPVAEGKTLIPIFIALQ